MNTVKAFFTHWKTSLAGIVASSAQLYAGGTSFKNVALSTAIAVLGLLSSDGDKKQQ